MRSLVYVWTTGYSRPGHHWVPQSERNIYAIVLVQTETPVSILVLVLEHANENATSKNGQKSLKDELVDKLNATNCCE